MLEFHHNHQQTMTLPSEGKKLTKTEEESMKIAMEEGDIRAIHPDRMEALADSMVQKLKEEPPTPVKGIATAAKGWRTCNPLSD